MAGAAGWNCPACTFANHPMVTVCEICEAAMPGPPPGQPPPPPPPPPPAAVVVAPPPPPHPSWPLGGELQVPAAHPDKYQAVPRPGTGLARSESGVVAVQLSASTECSIQAAAQEATGVSREMARLAIGAAGGDINLAVSNLTGGLLGGVVPVVALGRSDSQALMELGGVSQDQARQLLQSVGGDAEQVPLPLSRTFDPWDAGPQAHSTGLCRRGRRRTSGSCELTKSTCTSVRV